MRRRRHGAFLPRCAGLSSRLCSAALAGRSAAHQADIKVRILAISKSAISIQKAALALPNIRMCWVKVKSVWRAHNLSLVPLRLEPLKDCQFAARRDLQVEPVLLPPFIAVKVEAVEGCERIGSTHC